MVSANVGDDGFILTGSLGRVGRGPHLICRCPGQQYGPPRLSKQLGHYRCALFRGFPWPVDGFGKALAKLPVVVHTGEPKVHERESGKLANGIIRRARPVGHIFEELFKRRSVHAVYYPARV